MQTFFWSVMVLAGGIAGAEAQAVRDLRLEDLDLSEASTGYGEVQKGLSVDKTPLAIGGKTFQHGVGVHAASDMLFHLDGSGGHFKATVGVDDGAAGPGTVVFKVIANGATLFDSGVMKKGQPGKEVDVDLAGKTSLRLQVTDAGDGINFDHADWADARLTGAKTAPQPLPRWGEELPHYTGGIPKTLSAAHAIASPSGKVKAEVLGADGHLAVRVTLDGKTALEPSPIGILLDGKDLGAGAAASAPMIGEMPGEPYPWYGNSSSHTNSFRHEIIRMKTGSVDWTLEMRAYDDGVAWRCLLPVEPGTHKITGESTAFILPEKATYWSQTDTHAYEGMMTHFDPAGKQPHSPLGMPVTVELPGGGYACITEAETMGYSGMTLGPEGRILAGVFEDDPQGWTYEGAVSNISVNLNTPWRVVIAAPDLTALVNSSIVANVSTPPEQNPFVTSDWKAAPGRAYWTWFFGGGDTAKWDRIKGYIDDAASLNCQYYTIDDPWRNPSMGWHREGHDEWKSLEEFCAYAETKHVRLIVWQHWAGIRDEAERVKFFENVAKAGAAGVKIDFMESESHERLAFYHSCLALGMQHQLIVNFHGANKPAGEERTWPNALTREGIRGLEQRGNLTRSHFAALPFNRLVAGPGDFTPTTFRPDQLYSTTVGMQLATSVAYNSPLMHWADSASVYLAQPPEVIDFIKTKPVVWDEALVLPGSKIGELAVIARRDGKDWWICGLNGTDKEKDYSFALDFMKEAGAGAVLYQDNLADKTKFSISNPDASPGKKIEVKMAAGGGFAMVVRGKK